ncbi:MAG: hypothetical protein EBR82_63365, partial [Caulobacteraceae bacterium]|nr:hypothetical protein [Caulobacteraceae bacterium]
MQESLVDLNDPVPKTNVFTIESQGINREAIIPDTRGLQGEIVREGPIVTPRTQLPSGERLALLAEGEFRPTRKAEEAAAVIELEKGMEERIRQSPQGQRALRKDLEAVAVPEEVAPAAQPNIPKTVGGLQSNIILRVNEPKGIKLGQYKLREGEQFSPIKEVPFDDLGQGQSTVNQKLVEKYKKDILSGKPIDPITSKYGDVIDGYHRASALYELGFKKIPVTFVEENERLAISEWKKSYGNVPFPSETINEVSKSYPDFNKQTTIPRPMRGKAGEAGFIVSDVQEGAAKVAQKWLTTEGNLPKEMFDIMEAKGSRTQAMLKQIDFTLKDLANAARKLNGKPKLTPDQSLQVDQFLRGYLPAENLPEAIRPVAQQMRRQLDNLSEGLIQSGVFSQEIGPSGMSKADIIRMNKGEYLTRSYEKFDNPKYNVELVRKRNPAAYVEAENFVRTQMKSANPNTTEAEVQGKIKELVEGGMDKPFESLIQSAGIGKKLGITKARQDIPEQIRFLMGEYNDPIINYARSASKMINLLQSQEQLNKLKEFGVANKLFFERPTGNAATQIAADGSDTRSPLNGLYAEKDLVDAIENFEMFHKGGAAFQLYSMANAWVKWGKTVGSVQAQFRNPISNVLIEVVNGNFNFGGNLKPIKTILADFGVPAMDTKEGRAYLTRAAQLGVYDNTVLNEFTQMLKDAQQY